MLDEYTPRFNVRHSSARSSVRCYRDEPCERSSWPACRGRRSGETRYSPGDRLDVFDLDGVRVGILICYEAGREQLPGEPEPRDHFGLSCILDPFGEVLATAGEQPLETIAVEADLDRPAEANELLDWARDRRPDLYSPLAG